MPNDSFVDYSGQFIDGYQVDKLLMRHRTAARYLAYDSNRRPVFIEILHSTSEQDPALDGRFQQRMHTLMQHEHPGIAAVLHVGHTENDHAYAVSQYIVGPTLAEKLKEWRQAGTTLPVLGALQLVKHLAQALAIVHPLEIFHHDLRPANIILDKNNILVLIGLGIPYEPEPPQTIKKVDRLDYTAPEQRQGKPIDGRSNIYALGVILYELLTGHRPEIPLSSWHIFEVSTLPKEVPLKEARSGLTAATYELVNFCLGRQEWSRYDTIDQFIVAIDKAITAETASARHPLEKTRFPKWIYIAAPLVLLFLVLAGFVLARGNSEPDEVEPVPTTSGTLNTPTPRPTPSKTATAVPTEPAAAIGTAEPSPTSGPPIALLSPAPGLEIASDGAVHFDWSYPDSLTADQQFSVQLATDAITQTLGTVTRPVSSQEYQLYVNLMDRELHSGVYQWFVTLETISGGEELERSEQQTVLIRVVTPTPVMTQTVTSETTEPTLTATPNIDCTPAPPSNWVSYTVKEGDYLFNLALDTGTTVERLQEVNCLTVTGLGVGQRLWLPALPPTATPTSTPTAVPVPTTAPSSGGGGSGGSKNTPEPEKTAPPPP